MSGERYGRGGYIPGPSAMMRLVPESRPAVGGEPLVIYADECFISQDRVCRRTDEWHRAADIPADRFWICLAHAENRSPRA